MKYLNIHYALTSKGSKGQKFPKGKKVKGSKGQSKGQLENKVSDKHTSKQSDIVTS